MGGLAQSSDRFFRGEDGNESHDQIPFRRKCGLTLSIAGSRKAAKRVKFGENEKILLLCG
jgi:hypothetical protein